MKKTKTYQGKFYLNSMLMVYHFQLSSNCVKFSKSVCELIEKMLAMKVLCILSKCPQCPWLKKHLIMGFLVQILYIKVT